jgi:hypothetical protein
MDGSQSSQLPTHCPACHGTLAVTRLQCPACGTEVAGAFTLGGLATVPEPHASLLVLFLRLRGNMKEMERALGLSYPTVRARFEEALQAAGLHRAADTAPSDAELAPQRAAILDQLEQGAITAAEAGRRLRDLQSGR